MNQDTLMIPAKKRAYNEFLFSQIAPVYSAINKAFSIGRDAVWKRDLVNLLPSSKKKLQCLDLACGTGDVTFLLAERFTQSHIKGIDLTAAMLDQAHKKNIYSNVEFEQQDICDLQQPDNSVDIVTGAYAIRNAPHLDTAIKEIHRILKPGGVAAFLDFSKPPSRFLQMLEYHFLKTWCSFWGLVLHDRVKIYGYIAESLRHFPDRAQLRQQFKDNNFEIVTTRRLYFGVLKIILVQKK